jgi:hypothetical protein
MKKIKSSLMVLILLAMLPFQISAKDSNKPEIKIEPVESKILTDRLSFINEMDKSILTRTKKKALRQEVKSLNTDLATLGGGVYLTTGGVIIIILLLILLL